MSVVSVGNPRILFTAGYEGLTIGKFTAGLQAAGVTALIDVRRNAISRKKGFSKSALGAHLMRAGIAYYHDRRLGAPRAARLRLREDGDYGTFFEAYAEALREEEAAFAQLLEHLERHVCCLMCFERHQERCHRSVLAKRLVGASGGTLRAEHIAWLEKPITTSRTS